MSAAYSATLPVTSTATSRPSSLSRSGTTALLIRISGAGGMLLSHVVLANCLGVSGFGEYSQAIAWIQFLCVFGKCGLDNSSLRYVSEYVTKGETGKLRGFVQYASKFSGIASLLAASAIIATTYCINTYINKNLTNCLLIGSLMVPLISLRQVQEAALRGIGRMVESQISIAIWPLTLFLLAITARLLLPSRMTSPQAAILHLISVGAVSTVVYAFFRRSSLSAGDQTIRESCSHQWSKTAVAFFLAELLIALKSRVCVAMAGATLGSDSAGLYAAMEKFADASLLGSQSLGLVIAPQFASLFAAGRYADMRRLMWHGQILGLAFTLPVAIGVACFGDYLFLLMGESYRAGWTVLLALLASACITSFAGPAAYVLQMTGRERTMLVVTGLCAISNIVLSLALVRPFGILGFGIAQIITSLVWTVGVRLCLVQHPAWHRGTADLCLNTSSTKTTTDMLRQEVSE